MNDYNKEWDFLDILSIMSFIIGLENLKLNQEQVSHLEKHLESQDSILIKQQNAMLEKIIQQNEKIISMLKGEK